MLLQQRIGGRDDGVLPLWKTSLAGLVSGAVGPFTNAPIDTIKTRLQRMPAEYGQSAWTRISRIAKDMWR